MDFATLSERFAPLAEQDHSTRYAQGDLLVEARPLDSELAKLAIEHGYKPQTLKDRMHVSEAFPQGHRIRKIAWTIAKALLALDEPEQREEVLNSRPLREWSVNSIGHAIREYQEKNGLARKRGSMLGDVLVIPGFGKVVVKETRTGGKVVEILANRNISAKVRASDIPNEIRVLVEDAEA